MKAKDIRITELWTVQGTADQLALAEALIKKLYDVKRVIVTERMRRAVTAMQAVMGDETISPAKAASLAKTVTARKKATTPKKKAKGNGKANAKAKPKPKKTGKTGKAKLPRGAFIAAVTTAIDEQGPISVNGIADALVQKGLLPKDGEKNYDRVSAVVLALKAKGVVEGTSATGYLIAPVSATAATPGTVSLAPSAATEE